MPHDWWPK